MYSFIRGALLTGWLFPALALAHAGGDFSGGTTCGGCHASGSPTVTLSGPATLAEGTSAVYSLTITGGPAKTAGFDVDVTSGTLSTDQSGTTANSSSTQVTQSTPLAFSAGKAVFSFKVNAPATSGTLTIKGVGLSCNDDGSEGGDAYKATTMAVTITSSVVTDAGSPEPDAGSIHEPPDAGAGSGGQSEPDAGNGGSGGSGGGGGTVAQNDAGLGAPGSDGLVVAVTKPSAGTTLTGSVTLEAEATGPATVTSFKFFLNGTEVSGASTSENSITFDSSSWTEGPYTLSAEATDTNGVTATSSLLSVSISNGTSGCSTGGLAASTWALAAALVMLAWFARRKGKAL